MLDPSTTVTYVSAEPFERTLKLLRDALARQRLLVAGEMDLQARVRQRFGLRIPPCRVLYVDSPEVFLEAITRNRAVVVFLPVHVVLSAEEDGTAVYVMNPACAKGTGWPPDVRIPLNRVLLGVAEAVETIAMRQAARAA